MFWFMPKKSSASATSATGRSDRAVAPSHGRRRTSGDNGGLNAAASNAGFDPPCRWPELCGDGLWSCRWSQVILYKLTINMYCICHADTNRHPPALDRVPGLAPDTAVARRAGPGARLAGADLRAVRGAGLPVRALKSEEHT